MAREGRPANARRPTSRDLIVGYAAGQVVYVGVTPFLSRIYSPEDIGSYQTAFAVALLALPLATLRIEAVLPSRLRAVDVARLVRRARQAMTATCGVLAVGGTVLWTTDLGPTAGQIAVTAAVIVAVLGSTNIDNARRIRVRSYRRIGVRNGLAAAFAAALQVGLGLVHPSWVMLAVSFELGRILAIAVTSFPRSRVSVDLPGEDVEDYGRGRAASAITATMIANASTQAVLLFAGSVYGLAAAGQIALAQRIAAAPVGLLSTGLNQAMVAEFASSLQDRRRSLSATLRRAARRLGVGAALCALMIFAAGAFVVTPVLGDRWSTAATLVMVLAVPISFDLISAPLSNVFQVTGRQHRLLVLQITRLIGIVAVYSVCALVVDSVVQAVAAAGAFTVIWQLSYLRTANRMAQSADRPTQVAASTEQLTASPRNEDPDQVNAS